MREDHAANSGSIQRDLAGSSKFSSPATAFFDRPMRAGRRKYRLAFRRSSRWTGPDLRLHASGAVNLRLLSDGRLVANKLRVLKDSKKVLPPYDAGAAVVAQGIAERQLREC